MLYKLCIVFIFMIVISDTHTSRVLELSDRISEIRTEGQWLVMFYAPWCAHCKRLEPVWAHVAQALHNTNVRVGRIDCTRYTHVATKFKIQGFPTIMFLKSDTEQIYHGDRTKEELLLFAQRMAGPPVQGVQRSESLTALKETQDVFFVYTGRQEGPLWDSYYSVSQSFQPYGFFYATSAEAAKYHFFIDDESLPSVIVVKEKEHYVFPDQYYYNNPDDLNTTLHRWINEERFGVFPKITRGNINQILQTRKNIVLAVVEENKLSEIDSDQVEFRDMVESVIRQKRDQFHSNFQFGWIGTPDLANSIAMTDLPVPHLLVLNSTTNHHHLPEDDPTRLTPEALTIFLEQIHNQTAPVYGGDNWHVRVYRSIYEVRSSLSDMWKGNPVLTSVLFGLPLGFLALICYSICCADILDAEEESDNEEGEHEKNE